MLLDLGGLVTPGAPGMKVVHKKKKDGVVMDYIWWYNVILSDSESDSKYLNRHLNEVCVSIHLSKENGTSDKLSDEAR